METLEYGNLQELWAKLKDQIQGQKMTATKDSAHIVELFHQIQVIAAKIKAAGNQAILENDKEYIALVSNHLSKKIIWDWFKQRKSRWR